MMDEEETEFCGFPTSKDDCTFKTELETSVADTEIKDSQQQFVNIHDAKFEEEDYKVMRICGSQLTCEMGTDINKASEDLQDLPAGGAKELNSRSPTVSKLSASQCSNNSFDVGLEEVNNIGSDIDSDDEGDECVFDLPTRHLIGALDLAEDMANIEGDTIENSAGLTKEPSSFGPQISEFEWEPLLQTVDPKSRREKFTSLYGPVSPTRGPYEIFTTIWDYSTMKTIAVETNKYADQCLLNCIKNGRLCGNSRLLLWKETDADELYVFFALMIATGVVIKADLSEYWSVNQNIFDTPYFGLYMPYNRFVALGSMLHFVDNMAINFEALSPSKSRIYKIAPIVNHLNERFQANYRLGQCIALDESLTQGKGWVNIGKFDSKKRASRGEKSYELCDSNSGYLWRFNIHAGRDNQYDYITSIVLQLVSGLEYKGHTLFMDSFYNSPMLARLLKSQGFDCVGTLNKQRVPAQIKPLIRGTLRGDVHGCTSGDVDIVMWKNKSTVPLISTYHGISSSTRSNRTKPDLVHEYTVRTAGIDKKHQILSAYPLDRKRNAVWYKKLFKRLLNVSVINSYIIHKENPSTPGSPRLNHRQFRKALVLSLLDKHFKTSKMEEVRTGQDGKLKFPKAFIRHLPEQLPMLESGRRERGHCAVCKKRGITCCPGCKVVLCPKECFGRYHTVEHL